MPDEGDRSFPAHEEFFLACIDGAERAGLELIGRAAVSSTDHALRRNVMVHGTDIPAVLFLRHTSLFLTLPGSALLVEATYREEQKSDIPAAAKGRVVPQQTHPYWKLLLWCGTLPGRWWGDSRWLYVAEEFDGTRLYVSDVPGRSWPSEYRDKRRIQAAGGSGTSVEKLRDVCDGTYTTLLGWWPYVITPKRFGEAMANAVGALRPYLRVGKLLETHLSGQMIPLEDFPGCADAFVSQFPPERLTRVMDAVPYGLRDAQEIQRTVEIANSVYSPTI